MAPVEINRRSFKRKKKACTKSSTTEIKNTLDIKGKENNFKEILLLHLIFFFFLPFNQTNRDVSKDTLMIEVRISGVKLSQLLSNRIHEFSLF